MRINLNDLTRRIAQREGGKVNLPIAQVKEVFSLALCLLAEYPDEAIRSAIRRVSRRRAKQGAP